MQIESIDVAAIVEGVRRRKTLGNIAALAASINKRGLIHPIVVRNGNELVVGARRLEAFRRLQRATIPAVRMESLTDEELRAIELDENTQRKALDDFETSKARLAEIRQAAADLKAKAVSISGSGEPENGTGSRATTRAGRKTGKKRGRPKGKTPGSQRDVEEVTGISHVQQVRIERHVEIAERFPFMQRPEWKQHHVLEAGEAIDKLPAVEQPKVAALLDQDGIPPKTAIDILNKMTEKPVTERRAIYTLAASSLPHERVAALAQAAELPPVPDPALGELGSALVALKRAKKECHTDEFKQPIADLVVQVEAVYVAFRQHHKQRRERYEAGTTNSK